MYREREREIMISCLKAERPTVERENTRLRGWAIPRHKTAVTLRTLQTLCFNTCHPDVLQQRSAITIHNHISTKPPLRNARLSRAPWLSNIITTKNNTATTTTNNNIIIIII